MVISDIYQQKVSLVSRLVAKGAIRRVALPSNTKLLRFASTFFNQTAAAFCSEHGGGTIREMNRAIVRTGLEALYFSGSHVLLRPFVGGIGAILTLHHVRPVRRDPFQPNRLLEVTPGFLEYTIRTIRRAGIELVSLDEMHRQLTQGAGRRRFTCLTFDDGYRDNLRNAHPILKRYEVPYAIYVPTNFPDGLGKLWWLALEAIILKNDRIGIVVEDQDRRFECGTIPAKRELFTALYWWLRGLSTPELSRIVHDLAARYDVNLRALCQEQCMTWVEIAELAADPLVTIGAHSVTHSALGKMSEDNVRSEMRSSATIIEAALGVRPQHFCYPLGDQASAGPREFAIARELGFKTAVTTRPGVLFPQHRDYLTALPRISLNGEYQQRRFLQVLLSGAATAVWNNFRRVDAE
jgi:peptidoglycan/xylan/chitin deacetylase (PgdA/CDA1 family)